jgi:cytochrome c oxidase cbb3-type subunit 3
MNWLSDNVNQLSLLGAAAIILLTVFVAGKYIKQMKTDQATGELTEDNWDGIGEYKNTIPIGWGMAFVGTIIWGFWYFFIGYPLNAYSQIGEWNDEVKAYNAYFAQKWANPDKDTLMGMGEGVYLVQCAPCHGIAGDGIDGKAAGFDRWGTAKGVADTIKNGSKGLGFTLGDMPAGLLSDQADIDAVSKYVANGLKGDGKGKEIFATTCASCHGEDGKGMGGMSPDLTTYGTPAFVQDVLNRGKKGNIGVMPKFNDGRLTDMQKEAVGHYILSLGE